MAEAHDNAAGTVIGADTFIKGEMEVDNRARILGRFEGTIKAKGQMEIADKAHCKATVNANTLQVDGMVEGNITATDTVHLNASAKVKGDLVAAKLVVAEGAAFTGHVNVGPDAAKLAMGGGAASTGNVKVGPDAAKDQPAPSGGSTPTREPGQQDKDKGRK